MEKSSPAFLYMAVIVLNTPIMDPSKLTWITAAKAKGMFAKPIVNVFTDITIVKHFTLQTLEGPQQVKDDLTLCIGTSKADPWMMPMKEIVNNYNFEGTTPDGWMYFFPKPGITVQAHQVTEADFAEGEDVHGFQIYANAGHAVWPDGPDGEKKFVQTGDLNDYICQRDGTFWIVKKEVFDATYNTE